MNEKKLSFVVALLEGKFERDLQMLAERMEDETFKSIIGLSKSQIGWIKKRLKIKVSVEVHIDPIK